MLSNFLFVLLSCFKNLCVTFKTVPFIILFKLFTPCPTNLSIISNLFMYYTIFCQLTLSAVLLYYIIYKSIFHLLSYHFFNLFSLFLSFIFYFFINKKTVTEYLFERLSCNSFQYMFFNFINKKRRW